MTVHFSLHISFVVVHDYGTEGTKPSADHARGLPVFTASELLRLVLVESRYAGKTDGSDQWLER